MDFTRCFIAISFPDEVVEEIARIQELLQKRNFTGKLTELKNLHLTLKFLGEIDAEKLAIVQDRLKKIQFNRLDLKLGEVGTFARFGEPKIVWIKLEGQALWDLQSAIENVMHELGFKKEEKFMAHITLARIKYVEDKKGFRESVKQIKPKKAEFSINEFTLKKSELQPLGPIYSDIATYTSNSP
jgi:RNA 2',3'-cyclic 3'-phosphodiesterase